MQKLNPALIPDAVFNVCQSIRSAGGKAFLVGGCVRDMLLATTPKDFDLEVYDIELVKLTPLLKELGKTEHVGKQFGVTKLWHHGLEIDIALPRTERKTAKGHRGFDVTPDPNLSPENASARRDFTINALMFDPLKQQLLDFHNGADDLANRTLRHVSPAFAEDPLRVLRAMQFAARFNLSLHPDTAELCRQLFREADSLPIERIWQEWKKWSISSHPSRGLLALQQSGWIDHYPGLKSMMGCIQDVRWHPEGDVWTHTLQVVDMAADLSQQKIVNNPHFPPETCSQLLLAALCHDLGKPLTTFTDDNGLIRSPGHSEAGIEPTKVFLKQIGAPASYAKVILPLVKEHLIHIHGEPTDRAVRRLADRLDPAGIDLWEMLVEADASGRAPLPPSRPAIVWLERALALENHQAAPPAIINGDALIKLGVKPGAEMGKMLKACYEAQLDGAFDDLESGVEWCREKFLRPNG